MPHSNHRRKLSALATLLGSGALILSHSYAGLWPLALVGVAAFLWALYTVESRKTRIQCSIIFGMLYSLGVLLFFLHTIPVSGIGVSVYVQVAVVLVYWVLCSVALGLPYLLLGIPRYSAYPIGVSLTLFALLFTIAQYLAAHSFALFTIGDASLLGAHFSLGNVGYLFAEHESMRALAAYGGVSLLAGVGAFLGGVLFALFYVRVGRALFYGAVLFLVLFALSSEYRLLPGSGVREGERVSVVSSAYALPFAHTDKEAREARLMKSIEETTNYLSDTPNYDLVVFPEGASLSLLSRDAPALFSGVEERAILVSSYTKRREGKLYAYGGYVDTMGQPLHQTQKVYLTPVGEYMPRVVSFGLGLFGYDALRDTLENNFSYERGERPGVYNAEGVGVLGTLYCFEMLSPSLTRDLVGQGAEIIAVPSSSAWFNNSAPFRVLYRRVVQMRASELGRPVVVAGNMAPAYIINHRGEVLKESPTPAPLSSAHIAADIRLGEGSTLYARAGNWPVLVAFLLLFLFGLWQLYQRREQLRRRLFSGRVPGHD